jgi:hypothetical protein
MHKKSIFFLIIFSLITSLYAEDKISFEKKDFLQETAMDEASSKNFVFVEDRKNKTSLVIELLNAQAYAAPIDKEGERKILREKWERLLGIDIFYPYFKAKELEDWVSEKATVKFFNLKGRPAFKDNEIKYIFKVKF